MKLLKYMKANIFLFFLAGMMLNSGLILIKPLLLDRILAISEENLTMARIIDFIIYGFSLHLIFYSAMLLANFVSNHLQRHLQLRLKHHLLKALLWNKTLIDDEKVSIVTQDMELLYERFFLPLDILIGKGFILLTTILFILWQHVWLGLIFVAFSFLRPLPQFLMNRRLNQSGAKFSEKQKNFHLSVGDFFKGSETFSIYGAIPQKLSLLEKDNEEYETARLQNEWTSNVVYFFNGPLEFFSQVLPLALGLMLQEKGMNLTISSLIAMYVATMNLSGPIQTMMYSFSDIQRSRSVREKIISILEETNREHSYSTVENVSELVLEGLSKKVGERCLFQNLSLQLSKPCKVLIKGASGTGKSTLLRMIAKRVESDTGQLYVCDSKGEKHFQYQGNIAYISQHPFFSHTSIRDNLTLGQEISDETLLYFLEQVGLTTEIPAILDYQLINNGANISGGQQLRLELVRCLLRDKDILLADEITAALDKENAHRVHSILSKMPVILVEVAHHIDPEMKYDHMIDLKDYRFPHTSS